MKFYAGIGSRQTPPDVLALMTALAQRLASQGWTLRSGGADGADTAFEIGAGEHSIIYLPWRGFNGRTRGVVVGDIPRLRTIAEAHHPNWPACSRGARALHTRNVAQVLGHTENAAPSSMVICWTPNGSGTGGTGQAIRIARSFGIPVRDLGIPSILAEARTFASSH